MKEYIDASTFLGMHSPDEKVRVACKNYFVKRLGDQIGMSLEQVGKCDDTIWQYPREQQDAYYPFMDNLHTVMDIQRIPYTEKDISEAEFNPWLHGLDISDRLTVGMALAQKGILYTVNPNLINFKPKAPLNRLGQEVTGLDPKWYDITDVIRHPELSEELNFPQELEELYQKSLAVKI